MLRPQWLIMATGVALVAVGVVLIVAQIWLQITLPEVQFPSRSANLEGVGAKASVTTTYVGLVLVVIGAFLEVIGFIGSKPWSAKA